MRKQLYGRNKTTITTTSNVVLRRVLDRRVDANRKTKQTRYDASMADDYKKKHESTK